MNKFSLLLSLLVSLSAAACTIEAPVEELTKDDVRAMPIDDKADNSDWCEVFGWYDDGVCDDFCASPDPDCFVTCEMSDCPRPPEFSPRSCMDGSFVFASAECVADQESGSCGLEFSAGDCPEDRVCGIDECGPIPDFSPRPCDDGSFVFASGECVADMNGDCGLEINAGSCPEDSE